MSPDRTGNVSISIHSNEIGHGSWDKFGLSDYILSGKLTECNL